MTDHVLLLTPSRGLGGGIERYAATVEWVLQSSGLAYRRIDLNGSGVKAHGGLLLEALHHLKSNPVKTQTGRRAPRIAAASGESSTPRFVTGTSVVFHGSDVWARPRTQATT